MPRPIRTTENKPGDPIRLAVAPFADWTYEDAKSALKNYLPEHFSEAESFAVYKDHYRQGNGWVGPGEATDASTDPIKKRFAPEDAVGEVLTNIENAFNEPQIGTAPKNPDVDEDEARQLGAELLRFLSQWWDDRRMQELIQYCQRTGAWAGWANLRLWVPWRFLVRNGDRVQVIPASSFEQALSYIHVEAPSPDTAMIVEDARTKDRAAIFLEKETEYLGNGEIKQYERAEIVYLDPNRSSDTDADVIWRVVYSNEEKPSVQATLPLKGSLLTSEMRARVVITDPVIRTQKQLNFVTTLLGRIVETAGFRERYIKNAKPQGTRYPHTEGDSVPDGNFLERDDEGNLWRVEPQVRTLGAAMTTELVGLPAYDQMGEVKGNQTPDVVIVEPTNPKAYLDVVDAIRKRILRMCAQGHLGGSSNAEVSGIAYEQARAVFEKDLTKRRVSEEGMLRDLLTSLVTFAEALSGNEGRYTDVLRLTVDQHINPGPRSPDLVRLDLEAYEAGGMSLPTLLAKLGSEDTDAEAERIKDSAAHILRIVEQVTTVQGFTNESMIEVMRQLGVPDEVLDVMEVQEPPNIAPTDPVPPVEE